MVLPKPPVGQPHLGVGTSTPIAFVAGGVLYLERMNVLAEDGAGVMCDVLPKIGEVVPVVFNLSTRREAVRCKGEVLGEVATTPGGLALHQRLGAKAFAKVAMAGMGDSATVMFRLSDLEAQRKPKAPEDPKAKAVEGKPLEPPRGFCIRFVELGAGGLEAVRHHISTSRRMSEQLAMRGEKVVEIGENERRTMEQLLDERDISKKAMDW